VTAIFCPHCGTQISSDFNFCPKCGTKIVGLLSESDLFTTSASSAPQHDLLSDDSEARADQELEVLVCPTCGYQNPAGARACESCGTFLKGAERITAKDLKGGTPLDVQSKRQEQIPTSSKSSVTKKQKQKDNKQYSDRRASQRKGFHLESYQIVAIVAALLLGTILVYGLISSRPSGNTDSNSTQQQSTVGEPSADVIQEIDRLRQVVDKNPDDLGSTLRLSNMLQDNGMYDQAAIYYKRYLEKVPNNVDARVDYGITLFQSGHTQDAIDQLNKAIKLDPRHQKAYFNLGIVYLNTGEMNKSNDAFKKCVQIDPQSEVGKQAEQILEQHANIKN
jgi:tetratricopeptide (TPR) repeat protein